MQSRFQLLCAIATLSACTTGTSDPATASITGTATYRERMMLPPDATLEVTLEDVARADVAADVIARSEIELSTAPPFKFALSYDPSRIVTAHRYNVRARIVDNGTPIFHSDAGYAVLGIGNVTHVDILLKQASAATESTADFENTYWKLMTLGGKTIATAEGAREVHFVLNRQASRMQGFAGCNGLSGMYQLEGVKIEFTDVASTMMACAGGMETEMHFHEMLGRVAGWKIAGETLQLIDAGGAVIATFESRYLQ